MEIMRKYMIYFLLLNSLKIFYDLKITVMCYGVYGICISKMDKDNIIKEKWKHSTNTDDMGIFPTTLCQ